MKQLESTFKRTVNWNKYQSKWTDQEQNRHFDYLINLSFQRVNRLFLSFENRDDRKVHTEFYIQKVEIKDFNVIIDWCSYYWSANKKWFKNIW